MALNWIESPKELDGAQETAEELTIITEHVLGVPEAIPC